MKYFLPLIIFFSTFSFTNAQEHSVAREWSEVILEAIRGDLARPTIHARNLHHLSAAMYDAWAVYDDIAEPYLIGKTVNGFNAPFSDFPMPDDIEAARNEAVSHAAYNFLRFRYRFSPGYGQLLSALEDKMIELDYYSFNNSLDYTDGRASSMGNYIAEQYRLFGLGDSNGYNGDGANEIGNYANQYYQPTNNPLIVSSPGNPMATNMNTWQPLTLTVFIDQSGNVIPGNTPPFLSPEWGNVYPFALKEEDKTVFDKDGDTYNVYHDPGPPPLMDTLLASDNYKWGFVMNILWSAHLDKDDETLWDISPNGIGNTSYLPETFDEYPDFYNAMDGGINFAEGHDVNPATGKPYPVNMVKRGDYARVLAEFWADGPESETPPGHWFSILNYVMDHPDFERKYVGKHLIESDLEYDVKAYFMLGGAMHDCAITAWGIKGYYDYLRPISAIRCMADNGQSSDPNLPNYSNLGLPLIPDYIELVQPGDPLAGNNNANVNKVKVKSWRGPDYIPFPETTQAGVGWILAEEWWPYQRPSFVTPNFAGYISGHSTYSRAAAEILTTLTGDPYFPGGVGEFVAPKDEFLVFEEGPSEDITLQWATYRDASDETSLSRIWGGIHPPADDIPGRLIGMKIADDAFTLANEYFYNDVDSDGFYNYEDCDDFNPLMNPGLTEDCDPFDNDCNGIVNDGVPLFTYYFDTDMDGYGEIDMPIDTCITFPPAGYVTDATDCNDLDESIFPTQAEVCDAIDNDCDGQLNNGLERYVYFLDFDADGFGDINNPLDTCLVDPPAGFVRDNTDCNDDANNIYPSAIDIPDNGIDEDCSGIDLFKETKYLPSTFISNGNFIVHYDYEGTVNTQLFTMDGKLLWSKDVEIKENFFSLPIEDLPAGVYIFRYTNDDAGIEEVKKFIKVQ